MWYYLSRVFPYSGHSLLIENKKLSSHAFHFCWYILSQHQKENNKGRKPVLEDGTWDTECEVIGRTGSLSNRGEGFAHHRSSLNSTSEVTWLESSCEKGHTDEAQRDSQEAAHLSRQRVWLVPQLQGRLQGSEEKRVSEGGTDGWSDGGHAEGEGGKAMCLHLRFWMPLTDCFWNSTGGTLDSPTRSTVNSFLLLLITLASFVFPPVPFS